MVIHILLQALDEHVLIMSSINVIKKPRKPVFQIRDIFGTDPDPDPRIRASDQWIQILLFSSLTFKTPTKNNFLLITF